MSMLTSRDSFDGDDLRDGVNRLFEMRHNGEMVFFRFTGDHLLEDAAIMN